MFGPGEYQTARARVVARHGEEWAEWLDRHEDAMTYGPTYSRAIADMVGNVFHALGKGEPSSAQYWQREADGYADIVAGNEAMVARRRERILA
jgi:hypothetical protein